LTRHETAFSFENARERLWCEGHHCAGAGLRCDPFSGNRYHTLIHLEA
jgi:hypothetical protein